MKFGRIALLLVLALSGCGKDKDDEILGFDRDKSNHRPPPAQASPRSSQAIPNEARFNFAGTKNEFSTQRTFQHQNLKECRVFRDTNSRRAVFTAKFQDTANNSAMDLRVVTRSSDLTTEEQFDTVEIFGSGDNGSTINVSTGLAQGAYWNTLLEFTNAPPINSVCRISYAISSGGVKATIVCENLVNGSGLSASGTIRLSCAATVTRSQPGSGGPTPLTPTQPLTPPIP